MRPRSISTSLQETTTATPNKDEARERVVLDDNGAALLLFGQSNTNLKAIEREVGLTIGVRGNELTLVGAADRVALGRSLVEQLYKMAKKGRPLSSDDIVRAVGVLAGDQNAPIKDVFRDTVLMASRARPIAPKGLAQKQYVDAIRENDIVFGDRAGGHRQDLPRDGAGGARARSTSRSSASC